jgi:signal transduction histidine kinase
VALYTNGVQAGASAERATTLSHLLTYSLVGLAGLTVLTLGVGWILAGRILRPVKRITAVARAAGEHNLSQRLSLTGPRNELRDLADTFDAMLERLDSAFTGQRRFIANASHELRTPLTVMRTAIDVVLAKPNPTPGELTSMAIEVRSAVDHAERLIEALLVLARNEHARIPTETADLATITEDALEGRTLVDLTIATKLSQAPLIGDPVLLELLAVNLIDNAERYNIPHGRITISTGCELESAVLRIVNTGQPVPPEDVDHLFQPFTAR